MDTADAANKTSNPPILHILVVGFHHKLGCQVEFSYPPLIHGSTGKNECPSGWKYLSTLALPDGSHNFVEDTVFFNLPSLTEPTESVYGVSCYRQIPVEKLKIRTADVTRSTVQKSVCCLSRLPIYGYIEVKLSLIADAFFEEGDFSSTELLVKAYQQLNACLLDGDESCRPIRHFHVGISLREIVLQWRHKTLQLFKLFLLQRKVVCFGSPVRGMCALILGISSLIPRLLEKGFTEVACVRTSRPLSPMPDYTDALIKSVDCAIPGAAEKDEGVKSLAGSPHKSQRDTEIVDPARKLSNASEISVKSSNNSSVSPTSGKEPEEVLSDSSASASAETSGDKRLERSSSFTKDVILDATTTLSALSLVNPDEYRAPISIFASGNLCLPYLSLPYIDLLSDPSVLSYVIGTSNVLFQQRQHLGDVLVDIENANLDVRDAELRKQLVLSTEDLRFMDYILRHVQVPKEDAEGSENWIRSQFHAYCLAMLRTAIFAPTTEASAIKDMEHFNANFMCAFQKTQCYQEWYDVRPDTSFFEPLPVGHPFAGTLSVADMKLKIAQTMQNSESGRKINQAVNTTSRAVGGAISQAKGAFSYWWSSITTAPTGSSNVSDTRSSNSELSNQTQDIIQVTFQNSGETYEEGGISVHTEEKITFTSKNADGIRNTGAKGDGKCNNNANNEKLVESAEELMEENQISTNLPQGDESPKSQLLASEQRGGIVEIGREAEVLNREEIHTIDSAASNNGSVFIV